MIKYTILLSNTLTIQIIPRCPPGLTCVSSYVDEHVELAQSRTTRGFEPSFSKVMADRFSVGLEHEISDNRVSKSTTAFGTTLAASSLTLRKVLPDGSSEDHNDTPLI